MSATEDQGMITYPGYDKALLGVTYPINSPAVAVYDAYSIVRILVERDGMSAEEAMEYIEYNIVGMYVGIGTPIIVFRLFQ